MRPRLLYKAGFTVTGLSMDGGRLAESRDGLWERLGERFREIPQADPDVGYGVVWTRPEKEVHYLAGLAAGPGSMTPKGMMTQHFSKQLYAVFHHTGPLTALQKTVKQIFNVELPHIGYEVSGDYYFEVYDDRYDPGEADSIVFIWVPVRAGMKDLE